MFKKYKPTKIFDGNCFREQGDVLLINEKGIIENIVNENEAGDDIEILEGILSPGFINCHCHLELSHMKGLIDEKTGLIKFVGQVVEKRKLQELEILQQIENAENEMIQNGIVAVGDICNTTNTIFQKSKKNLYYHNFIEVLGFDTAIAEKNFEFYKKNYEIFCEKLGCEKVSLTPHAPYSLSEKLWKYLLEFNQDKLLSIHNQETADENIWFMNKTGALEEMYKNMQLNTGDFQASGKSSLQTYFANFKNTRPVILVHNVFTDEADIDFAENVNSKAFWCFCPNANNYITGRLPKIDMFVAKDLKCVLGTDSLASNHQLSIWEEIKTIQKSFPDIPLEILLRWATFNGASALGIHKKYGSFEKNKAPGAVLINTEKSTVKKIA